MSQRSKYLALAAGLPTAESAAPAGRAKPRRRANGRQQNPGHAWQALALGPAGVQAKLAVSRPESPDERAADQAADRVMSMEAPAPVPSPGFGSDVVESVRRKCAECEEEEEGSLQRSAETGRAVESAPRIVHETLGSPGAPLDGATREFMESRFGRGFGDVRVHTDGRAAESARAVNALAYTVGRDIVFRESQYAPATGAGRRLLAHELAHVTQQESGQVRVARQTPAPAPGMRVPNPPPPPTPVETKKIEEQQPPPEPEEKKTTKKRAPVGTSGSFKGSPTAALSKWDYVVYQDHVRLGNRKVDDSPGGPVIGGWPWMTNNPGDLTGDVKARKETPTDPDSAYRQDKRVWGEAIQRGAKPDSLSPVAGSSGLSEGNTAVAGFAARTDLAIFADRERGRRALKEWIQKYYGNITLAKSVQLHLGPVSSHVTGVDDPDKYPKLLQQFLSDRGHPSDYVSKTKGTDVKPEEWNDVIDAFGYAEGFFVRRAVAGQPGKFQYIENKGVVYRCAGRDPIEVDPAYRELSRVKNLPQDTPPEIKDLLGCE